MGSTDLPEKKVSNDGASVSVADGCPTNAGCAEEDVSAESSLGGGASGGKLGEILKVVSFRRWGRGWQYYVQRSGAGEGELSLCMPDEVPAQLLNDFLGRGS